MLVPSAPYFVGTNWNLILWLNKEWTLYMGNITMGGCCYDFHLPEDETIADIKERIKCTASLMLDDCNKILKLLDGDSIINRLRDAISDWKWHEYHGHNITLSVKSDKPGPNSLTIKWSCKNMWNDSPIEDTNVYKREYLTDMTAIRIDTASWSRRVCAECTIVKSACENLLKEIDGLASTSLGSFLAEEVFS